MRVGRVYSMTTKVDDEFYVGSTWNELPTRFVNHKSHVKCLERKNKSIAKALQHFDSIGWENVEINLLEECEFTDINDRWFRERFWMELTQPTLNTMKRPILTKLEKLEWERNYRKTEERKKERKLSVQIWKEKYPDRYKQKKKESDERCKEHIQQYRSNPEYKSKRNERRRNTVWHCDVCNVDVKGDSDVLKRHKLTKLHTSNLPKDETFDEEAQNKFYEKKQKSNNRHYEKIKGTRIQCCDVCGIDIKWEYKNQHTTTNMHIFNQQLYEFIHS